MLRHDAFFEWIRKYRRTYGDHLCGLSEHWLSSQHISNLSWQPNFLLPRNQRTIGSGKDRLVNGNRSIADIGCATDLRSPIPAPDHDPATPGVSALRSGACCRTSSNYTVRGWLPAYPDDAGTPAHQVKATTHKPFSGAQCGGAVAPVSYPS